MPKAVMHVVMSDVAYVENIFSSSSNFHHGDVHQVARPDELLVS